LRRTRIHLIFLRPDTTTHNAGVRGRFPPFQPRNCVEDQRTLIPGLVDVMRTFQNMEILFPYSGIQA
jgi:hypothetical protein